MKKALHKAKHYIVAVMAMVTAQTATVKAETIQFDKDGKIASDLGLSNADLEKTVIAIVQWILGFLGLISVIMIIIGGYYYLTSAGNEDKMKKGKDVIKAALIGMILVLLSYAIAYFVFTQTQTLAKPAGS